VAKIKRHIGQKLLSFHTQFVFEALVTAVINDPVQILVTAISCEKTAVKEFRRYDTYAVFLWREERRLRA